MTGKTITEPMDLDALLGASWETSEEVTRARDVYEATALIRVMRKHKGWTQKQLADALGVKQQRVSTLEAGGGSDGPSFAMLKRVARATGVDWPAPIHVATENTAVRLATVADTLVNQRGDQAQAPVHRTDVAGQIAVFFKTPPPQQRFTKSANTIDHIQAVEPPFARRAAGRHL